jgi:hypothetical protein
VTPDQMDIALAFQSVRFGHQTSTRFAAMTFCAMAQGPGAAAEMTILQEEYLYLIALKYHLQMPPRLVLMADRLLEIIRPLVEIERADRRLRAQDKVAVREAKARARQREQRQTNLWLRQMSAAKDKAGLS